MNFFKIGQIINTHGIKGEVKIYPYTDDIDKLARQKEMFFDENLTEKLRIESCRIYKNILIVKFKDIDSIELAEKMKNRYVYIARKQDEVLENNTYYIEDLIGCEVISEENNEIIGIVTYIWNTGSNDVYEVKCSNGNIYLPAIHDVVKNVDIKNKKIIVKLMEGLI